MAEPYATPTDLIQAHGSIGAAVRFYLDGYESDGERERTPEHMAYMLNLRLEFARRLWGTYVIGPRLACRHSVNLIRASRA